MVNVDELESEIAAVKRTVGTINYDSDLWLNRILIVGVLALAWYLARWHGYDEGRRRRLERDRLERRVETLERGRQTEKLN